MDVKSWKFSWGQIWKPIAKLMFGRIRSSNYSCLISNLTTTWCYFYFGSISSFFLELFLHWFPVAYWAPTDLGSSSFSVLSFCFFILFMGFSRQEYWSVLPFLSPMDHILSELFTMTPPSCFSCFCLISIEWRWKKT